MVGTHSIKWLTCLAAILLVSRIGAAEPVQAGSSKPTSSQHSQLQLVADPRSGRIFQKRSGPIGPEEFKAPNERVARRICKQLSEDTGKECSPMLLEDRPGNQLDEWACRCR